MSVEAPSEEHFRKLEHMYLSAPCNAHYEPSVHIEEGRAEIRIPVKRELYHAAHAVHGAAYFKAVDDSAYFAVNSLVTDVFVLTTQLNTYLRRPITEGEIRAVGRVVYASPGLYVAESVVTDGEGREIARGSGTFVRGKIPLSPNIGYCLE
jgi:uncharacterized protein (TIGR00369 family)